ncbi:Acetyl-coenzyme A synthetase [Auxenochlorella protothecoides]|uniref:Acetyl-coenzyme A synthetase n=1 Tax=Auxenochlorella protothecoides TaxID=3075 RepID=A0A087SEM5_AUXPR|nr:Acetyl-coenzyme A synthetase [Auxenochlorella protothecoides]KFM24179.1 Acetyl-coenzyme A synthetase [Auxenochlorella protothecoides]
MGIRDLRDLTMDDLMACKMTAQEAGPTAMRLKEVLEGADALPLPQLWRLVSKHVLHPDLPFPLHVKLYKAAYAGWDGEAQGPPPSWVPDPDAMRDTNIARFMQEWKGSELWRRLRTGDPTQDWPLLQQISFEDPESFWPAVLQRLRIRFHSVPSRVLARHADPDQVSWFPGARLNVAECALAGRDPDRPAVVWAEEGTPTELHTLSLGALAQRAQHVADALRAAGFQPGTPIAVDMVLTVDALVIYLGCVLAGCVVVSIADSFSAEEIASRLRISAARAVFTQDAITPLRAGADAHFHQDVRPGDVVAWPTSLGWMMGPWLAYAALLNGAAIALFHGAPTGRPFGQFVAAARVNVLGVVPSIVKAWRASGCMQGLDWSALRCFSSTGEASAPEDSLWLSARGGYKPVVEYCGGTELGGAFMSCTLVQPQAPSTFSGPVLGSQLVLLARGGGLSPHGDPARLAGEAALGTPSLGQSQTLLNRDHAAAYHAGMPPGPGGRYGLRRHGDEVERLGGGLYRALGRADDTMNLGGIKTSSAELERAVTAGVEGATDNDPASSKHLAAAAQRAISQRLNPLFRVHRVLVRQALPRNAANKVMRRVLRDELVATQSKL